MNKNRRKRLLWLLRVGPDYLSDAVPYLTKKRAVADFHSLSSQLARVGQRTEASLHPCTTLQDAREYPEYTLTLGPRGGVQINRA